MAGEVDSEIIIISRVCTRSELLRTSELVPPRRSGISLDLNKLLPSICVPEGAYLCLDEHQAKMIGTFEGILMRFRVRAVLLSAPVLRLFTKVLRTKFIRIRGGLGSEFLA